jgi:outer membrane lipoprotein-sorting protein
MRCLSAVLASATIAIPVGCFAASTYARAQPPAWLEFTRAWVGIAGYNATVTVFEQKGAQVQHVVFDYNLRKPSNVTVRVIKGPNAGVTLVWNGGATMSAHRGSGFTALFKRTLSLHDPAATTIRGSSIDQLSFGAILAHGQATPGRVSQARGPVIDGIGTDAVRLIPAAPAADTGLTYEIVEISKTTHFPLRVLGYHGRALVRRVDFSNVKLEP